MPTLQTTTQDSIARIRKQTDTALLFCSLGKDSIVLLDLIAPRFRKVICVFMYFVKGLEHVERWVRWAEHRYQNVVFDQIPHWNLTYILRCGMLCPPNPSVRLMRFRDVIDASKLKHNLPYVFIGMKMCDSMNRRLMLRGYKENLYENKGLVYPLAEWTNRDILAYMKQHNLPEPVRYGKKMSNGIGFNEDCLLWMRERFPEDLQKFYKVFPLAERIVWEYDQKHPQLKINAESEKGRKAQMTSSPK